MDVGKTIRRFVAEPLRDPFRRAPREPEPVRVGVDLGRPQDVTAVVAVDADGRVVEAR